MTRVTYGAASSSYNAIRSMVECANFERVSPEAQKEKRDLNVDHTLSGANSKKLQNDSIHELKQAKIELRKWTCSEASLVLSLLIRSVGFLR